MCVVRRNRLGQGEAELFIKCTGSLVAGLHMQVYTLDGTTCEKGSWRRGSKDVFDQGRGEAQAPVRPQHTNGHDIHLTLRSVRSIFQAATNGADRYVVEQGDLKEGIGIVFEGPVVHLFIDRSWKERCVDTSNLIHIIRRHGRDAHVGAGGDVRTHRCIRRWHRAREVRRGRQFPRHDGPQPEGAARG